MTQPSAKDIAVITGASSGIGAAFAHTLAAQGHRLQLVARRADRLDALADDLAARHGERPQTVVADLEDPAALRAIEDLVADPHVALLVNNAGAGGLGPTAKASADQLERVIRLNVTALTRLSHAALAGFRRRDAGTLINIGSVISQAPSPGGAVYSGSKAFVLNFTRSLQMEYARTPIRIQLVMPGPIRTEFFASQGMSDSVFPDETYLTADQLAGAALVGLAAGEAVTIPSILDLEPWTALETARRGFLEAVNSGKVAARYLAPG